MRASLTVVGCRLALLAAVGLMAACGEGASQLQVWVDQERQQAKPSRQTMAAPRRFDPQPYASQQSTDPFDPQKLALVLKQEVRQVSASVAQELNRRREPLESFPLEDIRMVGSLERGGRPFALIVADRLLYQVKVGDYLGRNYGRITRIAENRMELRELIQDGSGDWVERVASLEVQERTR